ncbi:MAG: flagellar filament capping protein FliD, partial [Candidatus Latescibacteria bacterium]|nr:flagellar filament capping protein FliD [Candidatus Latescibacterota bacterium]
DGSVVLTHRDYGSTNTFTVSGGAFLGIGDATYAGVDVAGSINGSVGTGKGRTLTSSTDNDNTRGMVINVSLTPEELKLEGQSQGAITLVAGIGDLLYGELTSITNVVDGFVQAKLDSIELSLDNLDSRIDDMNKRIDQRRESYTRKYTQLEMQMARLKSIQQQLSSSLSSLSTASFLS